MSRTKVKALLSNEIKEFICNIELTEQQKIIKIEMDLEWLEKKK